MSAQASVGSRTREPSRWRVRTVEQARASESARERLVAHGLDWLTLSVPAALALFAPVDRRMGLLTTGTTVARVDAGAHVSHEPLLLEYARVAPVDDPFAPRRWAESTMTVVAPRDVGGAGAITRSRYGQLLATHGFAPPTVMYLRGDGRIVALISLLRRLGDAPIGPGEIQLLRRSHAFLEHSYGLALQSGGTATSGRLLSSGLTPREIEIARLVVSGATNGEIARTLSVSVATVKTHMTHVLAKLGVRSRTELVVSLRAD